MTNTDWLSNAAAVMLGSTLNSSVSSAYVNQMAQGYLTRESLLTMAFAMPATTTSEQLVEVLNIVLGSSSADLALYKAQQARLAGGTALATVAADLLNSVVFSPLRGTSDTVFVQKLFDLALGRLPSDTELSYFVSTLTSGAATRGAYVAQVASIRLENATIRSADETQLAFLAGAGRPATATEITQLSSSSLATKIGSAVSAGDVSPKVALPTGITGLQEDATNDGVVSTTLTITLAGDTFKAGVGKAVGTVSGVPAGLKATLIETTDTTALLTLTGAATSHAYANSTSLALTFKDTDFTTLKASAITGATGLAVPLSFVDYSATVSSGLVSEVGSLTGTLDFNLQTATQKLNGATTTRGYLGGTTVTAIAPGALTGYTGLDATGLSGTVTVSFTGKSGQNNTFLANNNNATALGSDGDDILIGGNGNDTLNGGTGSDVLVGGAGNDILTGGSGNNVMTGGTGKDTFVISPPNYDSTGTIGGGTPYIAGLQFITDYETGSDTLKLTPLLQKPTVVSTVYTANDWDASQLPIPLYQVKNGDVVFVESNGVWGGIPTAAQVAALFTGVLATAAVGAVPAVAGTPFKTPLSTFEAVVVTGDLLNGADVWYVHNDDATVTTVSASEIVMIAHLSGNWNFLLTGVSAITIV